jgi:hypothetical protein
MLAPSDEEVEAFGSVKAARQIEAMSALEFAGYDATSGNISAMGPALEDGLREQVERRYAQVFPPHRGIKW